MPCVLCAPASAWPARTRLRAGRSAWSASPRPTRRSTPGLWPRRLPRSSGPKSRKRNCRCITQAPGCSTSGRGCVEPGRAAEWSSTVIWTPNPLGDPSFRTRDPAGEIDGNRLYGRGAADMKGGIAASIAAFARHREIWSGEAVPTLAGDEESMGQPNTRWLLDHVPHARGGAVILGDAGSPRVLRFGGKGFPWMEIEAACRAWRPVHLATTRLSGCSMRWPDCKPCGLCQWWRPRRGWKAGRWLSTCGLAARTRGGSGWKGCPPWFTARRRTAWEPDEWVDLAELDQVARVQALAAFDLLTASP